VKRKSYDAAYSVDKKRKKKKEKQESEKVHMRREELHRFMMTREKVLFFRLTFAKSWYTAKSCKISYVRVKLYKALDGFGDLFFISGSAYHFDE